jgi:hypothetical protein
VRAGADVDDLDGLLAVGEDALAAADELEGRLAARASGRRARP